MFRYLAVLMLFLAQPVPAAPATESTIKQLLVVSQAQKLGDGVQQQFEAQINNLVQDQLKGYVPTARQQAAIETMKKRFAAVMRDELGWEKMEPLYIRLYKASFTEEELVGMLRFYQTPAGQALIKKMPVLMQNMMLELQTNFFPTMMPKLELIQKQFMDEIKRTQ